MSDQINPHLIYTQLQKLALRSIALQDDEEYVYRFICRWYSQQFYTPLHEVYKLPWDFILQHYYEYSYEKLPKQDLYQMILDTACPDMVAKDKEDFDEWVKEVEEEERIRQEKKQGKEKIKEKEAPTEIFKSYE